MILQNTRINVASVAAAGAILMSAFVPAAPVQAQARPHRTFAQKHPTLTGAAAGVGAYSLAKKTGANRARAGRKRNFAQRHPVLTGMAAGVVVHHYAKKHRH